jgi:hypothetical protein
VRRDVPSPAEAAGENEAGAAEEAATQASAPSSALDEADRGSRLSRERGLDLLVGGGVLLVCLLVQLALLQGPRPLDPARYFDTAVEFPNIPVDLWTLRIGLIAPVRLAVLVFGPSEASFYGVPIAAGLLLAAAVYGTMLLLFRDRVVAAAAALVTALNASYLFTSSFIYPDTTATATFTAGFFFLVLAAVRSNGGDEGWVPTVAAIAAGALFGWTYLIREFSPFLLPAVVAAIVLFRYPLKRAALLAGAAVATAGLELVYGWARFGDPFIHAHQLLDRNHTSFSAARGKRMDHIQGQLDNVIDATLVLPRLLLSWRTGWLLVLVLVVFLVTLVLVRDRRLWVLGIWGLSYWAIMIAIGLGELPSGRWILNITNVRYWYPLLPAVVMGAFGGLWLLVRRWSPGSRGLRIAQIAAVALAVTTLAPGLAEFRSCSHRQAWWNDPAVRWHELRSWFASPAARQYRAVWTDGQTKRLVPIYTATNIGRTVWPGNVKAFSLREPIAPKTDPANTLILVHKARLRTLSSESQMRLDELRGEWAPVFVSDDGEMALLAHRPGATAVGGDWWDLSDPPPRRARPGRCGRSPYEQAGS